jgi:hypothetical protein
LPTKYRSIALAIAATALAALPGRADEATGGFKVIVNSKVAGQRVAPEVRRRSISEKLSAGRMD